jgi:hypothetical protein
MTSAPANTAQGKATTGRQPEIICTTTAGVVISSGRRFRCILLLGVIFRRKKMETRLEVLERESKEAFDRWHDERRKREAQAGELERLRDCAGRVISAFETLGRTSDVASLLTARARCESLMLELQSVLMPSR